MKIGCCTACLSAYYSLPETVERIAALGFEAVELNVSGDGAFPGDMDEPRRRELLMALGRSGLPVHAHVDLTYIHRRALVENRDFFELFRRLADPLFEWQDLLPLAMMTFDGVYGSFAVSAAVRAGRLPLAGRMIAWLKSLKPVRRAVPAVAALNREATLRAMQYALARAAGSPMRVGLENYLEGAASAGDLERLSSGLKGELGLLLDTGHAHIAVRRGIAGADTLAGYVERASLPLIDVHVSDNDGTMDAHRFPGEGTIDFPSLFAALARKGYGGPVMLEAKAPTPDGLEDRLRSARAYLLRLLRP